MPDDSAPWFLNYTYIGANHGCDQSRIVTVSNHELTTADIGSCWSDDKKTDFYIIKIVDSNNFVVLSDNIGKHGTFMFERTLKGNQLKARRSKKVLNVEKWRSFQLIPSCRINSQTYLLNGRIPLEDGKLVTGNYLQVIEDYDIISPLSILDYIKKNPRSEISFISNKFKKILNNNIDRIFSPNGACTTHYKSKIEENINMGHMGFIQTAPLVCRKGSVLEYYVPKTLPFELSGMQYDFKNIQDFSSILIEPINFGDKYLNIDNRNNLPERFIQILGEREDGIIKRNIGYAFGYSLVNGVTKPKIRSGNCSVAMQISRAKKSYPHAVGKKMKVVEKGREFECFAYRQYFDPQRYPNTTSFYYHRENDAYIMYVDYHQSIKNDVLKLPVELVNKKMTIIEKTKSLIIVNKKSVSSRDLVVSVNNNYGYIVLKFE